MSEEMNKVPAKVPNFHWTYPGIPRSLLVLLSAAAVIPSSQGIVSSIIRTDFFIADHMTMSRQRVVMISLGNTSCHLRYASICYWSDLVCFTLPH